MTLSLQNQDLARLIGPWVEAGVLSLTDVHVADRLGRMAGEAAPRVLTAVALAVRAPRHGHTGFGFATDWQDAAEGAPAPRWTGTAEAWREEVSRSPLVGASPGEFRPLVLRQGMLQLHRMADYESRLAAALGARAEWLPSEQIDVPRLQSDLRSLMGDRSPDDAQLLAVAIGVLARTTVISGGPGTGKTTTIRQILLALLGQARAAGKPLPSVALAAPTGKAAARMRESLLPGAGTPLPAADLDWLSGLQAVTLHRLLGWQPHAPTRFRHGPASPLPVDVVVVDEASMIDLALMCKLVEAVPTEGRLLLLGDRNQLASVEAGCVLADLTAGAGAGRPRLSPAHFARIEAVLGAAALQAEADSAAPPFAAGMVHFDRSFRFDNEALRSPIEALGQASRLADPGQERAHIAVALRGLLQSKSAAVRHVEHRNGHLDEAVLAEVADAWVEVLRPLSRAPASDEVRARVLSELDAQRVLCAHRAGRLGVIQLNRAIAGQILEKIGGGESQGATHGWWTGRIVLVTVNDNEHDLWNGDVGVVAQGPAGWEVVFASPTGLRAIAAAAMPEHETAFAMTIHKSQGSQFGHAVVVLPEAESALLSRELIYTGISRARQRLTLCGSRQVLQAALERRIRRATALAAMLWPRSGAGEV